MVSEGAFRTDLYTRISDLTVALPPLRQRLEDIPLLLRHLIRKHDGGHRHLTVEVVEHLCCRPWPGNVRELESVIRRALHRAMGKGTPPYQSPAPYHSFKQADAMPLEPGVVAELRFDLLPTSYLFERGHRVRVAIGCADHTVFELRPSHPPQLQMHRSAEHPSHIVLPTMPEV